MAVDKPGWWIQRVIFTPSNKKDSSTTPSQTWWVKTGGHWKFWHTPSEVEKILAEKHKKK